MPHEITDSRSASQIRTNLWNKEVPKAIKNNHGMHKSPLLAPNLANAYRNTGLSSTAAKHKYYGKNFPSLPLSTLNGK